MCWLGARALTRSKSGHPARPVLGWVARVEYPVPSHYTCQAVQSGYGESISWLSTVLRKRRKIEVPPTWWSMLGGVKDTTQGVKVWPVCGLSSLVRSVTEHKKLRHCNPHTCTQYHHHAEKILPKRHPTSCQKKAVYLSCQKTKAAYLSCQKMAAYPKKKKKKKKKHEEEAEKRRSRRRTN